MSRTPLLLLLISLGIILHSVLAGPPSEKDSLQHIIASLSKDFLAEKSLAEKNLFNVHVEALQRKIAAVSAESDAAYSASLLSASLRLLQTVKLIDTIMARDTDPFALTGKIAEKPARDCSALRKGAPTTGEITSINDGVFWVRNSLHGVTDLYRARCDMTVAGGGWQLFALKTKEQGVVENTDALLRDLNRDRLTDVRHYAAQFNTLNLQRFDNLYGKEFEILVKVGDSLFEPEHHILITNMQRTSGAASDVAQGLVAAWKIPQGEKCVPLADVGRACLIKVNGDELDASLDVDVDPFSTSVVSSFWIRK